MSGYLVIFVGLIDRSLVRSAWAGQERNIRASPPSFVALVLRYLPHPSRNFLRLPSQSRLKATPYPFILRVLPVALSIRLFHLRDIVNLGDHVAANCRKGSRASCQLGYAYRGSASKGEEGATLQGVWP